MRTNIDIDDALMRKARAASGAKTKREIVEEGLRLIVQRQAQREILQFRGKIHWEGDLEAMRLD